MTRGSWSGRRRTALLALTLAVLVCAALSLLASIWFLTPVPLLAAAAYAVVLGMTPSRFLDALDDRGSGSGTQLPF